MAILIGVSLGLIVGGLLTCWLSDRAGRLGALFWWIGIVLAVIGILFLATPALVWLNNQLRIILGL